MPLVRQLFEIINNTQLYDNVVDPKTKQSKLVANQIPMSVSPNSEASFSQIEYPPIVIHSFKNQLTLVNLCPWRNYGVGRT